MNTNPELKVLTLGDFIMSVYEACDDHRASVIVWLAVNAHLVVFQSHEVQVA